MEIDNKKYYSSGHLIEITLKRRLSELVLECCQEVPSVEISAIAPKKRTCTRNKAPIIDTHIVAEKASAPKVVVKTLNSLINADWNKLKKEFQQQQSISPVVIENRHIVMAKMNSYSPWGARVEGFNANRKRVHFYFFGTDNRGTVDSTEVIPFQDCHSVIRLLLLRKTSQFHKSIVEVEKILNVPDELSLLNEQNSLKL